MKTRQLFILPLLLAALLAGCSKSGCFEEAGAIQRAERKVTPFNKIDLFDNINLVLTQDTVERLWVEASKNLVPHITTDVQNGILTIKNTVSCSWLRRPLEQLTVYASLKKLRHLNYNGSGNVRSTNTLQTEHLQIESNEGAGNIYLAVDAHYVGAYIFKENADVTISGKSNVCFSYVNARGSIDFKNLEVKKLVMEYGGVKDATVHVTEELDVTLYHTGNLYYKGNPAHLKKVEHSTGRLLRLP